MIEDLIKGFLFIASFASIASALSGLIAGIIVGALPGLTATMAVAVLSPFTFFMEPSIGIPFLLSVYKGAIYGGSIPASMWVPLSSPFRAIIVNPNNTFFFLTNPINGGVKLYVS
jgi:TctA family transporter